MADPLRADGNGRTPMKAVASGFNLQVAKHVEASIQTTEEHLNFIGMRKQKRRASQGPSNFISVANIRVIWSFQDSSIPMYDSYPAGLQPEEAFQMCLGVGGVDVSLHSWKLCRPPTKAARRLFSTSCSLVAAQDLARMPIGSTQMTLSFRSEHKFEAAKTPQLRKAAREAAQPAKKRFNPACSVVEHACSGTCFD